MMNENKHEGCERGFTRCNDAWYSKAVRDVEVMFGMYHHQGGTTGEMKMLWMDLGNRLVPQLRVFEDSWDALHSFSDLIQKLKEVDGECISVDKFCDILIEHGFKDRTEYENPHKIQEVPEEEKVMVSLTKGEAEKLGLNDRIITNE